MVLIEVALAIVLFADFLLDLAGILFDIACDFLGGIVGDLADAFFDSALYFMLGAFNAILIHNILQSRLIATGRF
jgi:hypothetical protein